MMPVLQGSIERVVVFRALMLGDLLCAVPALRALRQGFPAAQIALVGLPWTAALAARLSCVDEFIEMRGAPGLPEIACDVQALPGFLERVQRRRFDLAVQLHGSGSIVNPLVAAFGARQTAGFCGARAWRPPADAARYAPWPERGHEIERLLVLIDRLGLPRCGTRLEFPLNEDDRSAATALSPGLGDAGPYVCIHAGAQLASRRWPVQRFAALADALAADGRTIVLTGGPKEVELVGQLAGAMRHRAINLAGRTSLWTLGALIDGAECLVCNDTGVSHIAAALRRSSVVISSGGDVARWAPVDHERHRVLWHDMACRPCGHPVCPVGHGCALGIEVPQVLQAVRGQRQFFAAHALRNP